jgi:hypothetical protein
MSLLCKLGWHKWKSSVTMYPPVMSVTFNLAILYDKTCTRCGVKGNTWSDWIFKNEFGEEAHQYAVEVLQNEGWDLTEYFKWLENREQTGS